MDPTAGEVDLSEDHELAPVFALADEMAELFRRWRPTLSKAVTSEFKRVNTTEELNKRHGYSSLMCLAGVSQAYKTFRALELLCKQGYGEDAETLLRSLFEIAVQLSAVRADPWGDRAEVWVKFDDARRLKRQRAAAARGETVGEDPVIENRIQAAADEVQKKWGLWSVNKSGDLKLKAEAGSGESVAQLAKQAGMGDHYTTLYDLTSERAHFGARAADDYLNIVGDEIELDVDPSPNRVGKVLISATTYFHLIMSCWHDITKPAAGQIETELLALDEQIADQRRRGRSTTRSQTRTMRSVTVL